VPGFSDIDASLRVTPDLHLHSWLSDGRISPSQVVQNARAAGLDLIALTDHDTAEGFHEAAEEAQRLGIHLIPGVELTSAFHLGTCEEIHILGYFIDADSEALRAHCREAQSRLRDRLGRMLDALRTHGIEFTLSEIEAASPHTLVLDRPHLAKLMADRGAVSSFSEAFRRHLGSEGDCFVPLTGPSSNTAIQMIKRAGGIAVLAHPHYVDYPNGVTEDQLAALVDMGLEGLEVYHAHHSPQDIERFSAMAERFDLIVTGGTDCHGVVQPDGKRLIDHPVVPSWVGDQLLRRSEDLVRTD
jgi:predicted metal-dependent phosphoesterase TrpH